ncbi:ATP-binding protein [Hahella ganghwensis]|uniref:ATP-binding protein n=1 Tax=Hahella ganghwensis TaxID=286420 RepID=UPI00035F743B|nr:ATP-binding protein [Hahella ganghwensis]
MTESETTRPPQNSWILLTAVVYFVTGRLGLAFAADSAYATAVWIPSGIALAAVLIGGYRQGFGIWLGSFLVNYTVTLENSNTGVALDQVALLSLIGVGAAIQAMLSRYLVMRYGRYPNTLSDLYLIFLFIILTGPVSCLVSATVGCTALTTAGLMPVESFPQNWAVWWLGDSIGAAIFGPLILVWALRPVSMWKSRRLVVSLTLVITFILATVGFYYARSSEENNARLRLETEASAMVITFEQSMKAQIGVLETVGRHLGLLQRSSRGAFEVQVGWLLDRYDNLQALSWNPVVNSRLREYVEFVLQRDYGVDTGIRKRVDGRLVPSRDEVAVPVQFIMPYKGNENALGYDTAANPVRKAALEKASKIMKPVITERINLVQDDGKQPGILIFFPKFSGDSVEAEGYFTAVTKIGQLLEQFFESQGFSGFYVRVLDTEETGKESEVLYQSKITQLGKFEPLPVKESDVFESEVLWKIPITVADREWVFVVAPTRDNYISRLSLSAWLVYVLGLLFSVMSGMVALFFTGRTVALETIVRQRTTALRDSENSLKAIVDNTPDALLVVDVEGVIVQANRSAESIFLRAMDELVGAEISQLIPSLEGKNFHLRLEDLQSGAGNVMESFGVRRNGAQIAVDISVSDYGLENQLYHLVMVRDITERAEIDRIKDEFISTVSHELRTPLTAIKGALSLIKVQPIQWDDKSYNLVDIAERNSQRLLELVNRILDFKKITEGDFMLRCACIPVHDWLNDICRTHQTFANQYHVEFVLDHVDDDLVLWGDGEYLTQVMVNLMSNAAKFSKPDTQVHIHASRQGDCIRIEVCDTGPGIPEEFSEKIFGRFSQADSSSTRSKDGSGLGLNISKAIVEKHGGSIHYQNRESGGCIFYFDIPQAPVSACQQIPEVSSDPR